MKIEMTVQVDEMIQQLKELASQDVADGQGHFGILGTNRLGVSIPNLRKMAKGVSDHDLALQLWQSGYHDARLLAGMVDIPEKVSREQMEAWVQDFDSWDLCDQVCSNLFDRTPFAVECALDWMECEAEYVRRAGFVMVAALAVHRKTMPDTEFLQFFPNMKRFAVDDRNFVRKAVNWALRQVGKSRPNLREKAIETAREIGQMNSATARWIAADALRELERPLKNMNGKQTTAHGS